LVFLVLRPEGREVTQKVGKQISDIRVPLPQGVGEQDQGGLKEGFADGPLQVSIDGRAALAQALVEASSDITEEGVGSVTQDARGDAGQHEHRQLDHLRRLPANSGEERARRGWRMSPLP
jgi:hypothetical protein